VVIGEVKSELVCDF